MPLPIPHYLPGPQPFQALPHAGWPSSPSTALPHYGVAAAASDSMPYSSGGGGYSMPSVDYAGLLQSMLGPLRSQAASMAAADAAALKAQQRRAVIQFGEAINPTGNDVSLLGSGFDKAINAETLRLAKENTTSGLSVLARLNQAHSDAVLNIRNSLAARGILQSGETGYQMGREQTASLRSQYDARQQVLDYLAGIQSAFAQAEQQRQWALAQAAMSAAASIPFVPPAYGGGGGGGGGAPGPDWNAPVSSASGGN